MPHRHATEVVQESTSSQTRTRPPVPPSSTSNSNNNMSHRGREHEEEGSSRTNSRFRSLVQSLSAGLNRLFTIVTYPCMVVFTLISLIMVITFCIFPTLLCMTFGICIYYCLVEDPIPLSVMLRYMLSPDPDDTPYPNLYPFSQQKPVIQSKLIVRKLLQIEDLPNDDDEDINKNNDNNKNYKSKSKNISKEYPRKHPYPITISTNHKCLHFSEPLILLPENDEDKDENGEGKDAHKEYGETFLPHYQRTAIASTTTTTTMHTPTMDPLGRPSQVSMGDDNNYTTRTTGRTQVESCANNNNELEMVTISIAETNADTGADGDENEGESHVALDGDKPSKQQQQEPEGKLAHTKEYNSISMEPTDRNDDDDNQKVQAEAEEEEEDYFGITNVRDRGTTCDICLLEYQVGDTVAWSPNLDCSHAFHKDCVLDWLIRKPTCPNCRHDYLKGATQLNHKTGDDNNV